MKAEIVLPTAHALSQAALALSLGQVVAIPTETVYGLAGNALNPEALAQIFSKKQRPTFDPLILHVKESLNSIEALAKVGLIDLSRMSAESQRIANALMKKFWPGPLTLILPKTGKIPDLATSGLDTAAFRMPAHPVAQTLLQLLDFPLAAPSANQFGKISPTCAQDVMEELGDRIEIILDGGPCTIGVESTILSVTDLTLLRPGKISAMEISQVAGQRVQASPTPKIMAPGMFESHYAPTKKLTLLPQSILNFKKFPDTSAKTIGLLLMSGSADSAREKISKQTGKKILVQTLSESGNLNEAAQNLFAMLRALDHSKAEILFAEPCLIQEGIGHAIGDRLKRASTR